MTDPEPKTRGYDDNALLKEMASGIITRQFSSVDVAAKSVIGDRHPSNAERLRRKFREQGWYERGLAAYVNGEIARRSATAIGVDYSQTELHQRRKRKIISMLRIPAAAMLSVLFLSAAFYPFSKSDASEDPVKLARIKRATDYATDAVTGLYNLDFANINDQTNRNVRYFIEPGTFVEYTQDLKTSGLDPKIRDGRLVLWNEAASTPRVADDRGSYAVSFDVRRSAYSSSKTEVSCFRASVYVVPNKTFGFGSSEFGLVGLPRLDPSTDCH